jgi:hypothetical protein
VKKLYLFFLCSFFIHHPIFVYGSLNGIEIINNGYFLKNNNLINDSSITYFSNNKFGKTLITENSINFQFIKKKVSHNVQNISEGNLTPEAKQYDILNIKQNFANAHFSDPSPIFETKSSSNYFIGNDPKNWHVNQPNLNGLFFKNIYNNIDLKIYSSGIKIKYDIVLKPGANIADIKTSYQGAENVKTNNNRSKIIIETKFGIFEESLPEVFQIIDNKKILLA